ncbi:RteC domain-containing protein [Chryseobacterium sp. R2A-55]|uniref:RteC domain-containing protein n=1 Tax=Chryseobacterium sp. R2A-55 TaxID=2744445 RepID=UPI001F1BED55|nr:RteC domain-containing protein [Chryseobacterium sp. R2A-55]
MNNALFFEQVRHMYRELLHNLESVESESHLNKIQQYEKSLMEIDNKLRKLKSAVAGHHFGSIADEVHFFKEHKPAFVAQYLYFSKVLDIEVSKPAAGQYVLKEYYELEMKSLKNFNNQYQEFYDYYRRGASYLDEKYFVRGQFDIKMKRNLLLYDCDEGFATAFDHHIAVILCNDRIESYLLRCIYEIDGYINDRLSKQSPFQWTGPKTALVELIYAIYLSRSINGGNIELSELIRFTAKTLNIELGNFYKILHEIKSRKTGHTKFLDQLKENLEARFEEEG